MLDRPEDELPDINEIHEKGAAGPKWDAVLACGSAVSRRQT
jgi:hypothetical protein